MARDLCGMRERLIGIEQPDAWRAALVGMPHAYWHTWEACHSASLASGLPTFLYVCEDDDSGVRAACPFSERRWQDVVDVFTPTGFSGFAVHGDAHGLRERWLSFVAERGYVCAYFALHPILSVKAMHGDLVETNHLFVMDLTVGEEQLFTHVDRSVRRSMRDWNAGDARYVTDRNRLSAFILETYRPFMTALKANPAAMWSEEGLLAMCADPAMLMAGVADEDGVCAAYTFATTPSGAECHLNISVREGRRFTTPLIWWGVRELSARGIPWMNLGGGLSPNDTVAQAKQKFRACALPLLSAREVYRPDLYRALCAAAGIDPVSTEGFFPGYRVRPLA